MQHLHENSAMIAIADIRFNQYLQSVVCSNNNIRQHSTVTILQVWIFSPITHGFIRPSLRG